LFRLGIPKTRWLCRDHTLPSYYPESGLAIKKRTFSAFDYPGFPVIRSYPRDILKKRKKDANKMGKSEIIPEEIVKKYSV